jgi:hypothetical protein
VELAALADILHPQRGTARGPYPKWSGLGSLLGGRSFKFQEHRRRRTWSLFSFLLGLFPKRKDHFVVLLSF